MGNNCTSGQNTLLSYRVDISFVMDATGSMQPFLSTVKAKALSLYPDITSRMNAKGKKITQLRGRIIAYRDFLEDGNDAMLVTDFFDLNTEAQEFSDCINSIEAKGGGDDLEDGLEAVAMAMASDWVKGRGKRRQIVAVWSDAGCHDIGYGKKAPNYPKGMPKNHDELFSWWGSNQTSGKYMDMSARRLLLFTPDTDWWSKLRKWSNTVWTPMNVGGFSESDYKTMIEKIVNSI